MSTPITKWFPDIMYMDHYLDGGSVSFLTRAGTRYTIDRRIKTDTHDQLYVADETDIFGSVISNSLLLEYLLLVERLNQ